MSMHIVADIGGTNMRIAGSNDLRSFTDPVMVRTPHDYTEGMDHLVRTATEIAGGSIESIVVGLPVLLTPDKRSIVSARNIPDWSGKSFADDVEKALSTRVHIENDVALVGLGEAVYGAGKNARRVVYVTVSTGVNAALIIDHTIDPYNLGVSTGCQYVSMGETPVTWEDMISGSAIHKKYGKHPREIEKNDALWEELARITAFGVHNTLLHWTPDRVVLGGSMFNDIGIPVDRVTAHLESLQGYVGHVPEVVHSALGEVGGLWGGLALLSGKS